MVNPSLRIYFDLMFIPDPSYPDPVLYVKSSDFCNGSHHSQGSVARCRHVFLQQAEFLKKVLEIMPVIGVKNENTSNKGG
jgi:hypothetical protein